MASAAKTAERHAEGKGARVAHEDGGRVAVVPEEAHAGAGDGGGKDGEIDLLVAEGDHGHDEHDHHGAAAGQAVEAVGEVDGVGQARHEEEDKDEVDPGHREGDAADGEGAGEHAQVKDEAAREAQLRGDADDVDRNQAERHRDEDEAGHLLGRREAQGALVGHGLDVVQKAERARDQHGDKSQDQVGRPLGKKGAGEHDAQQDGAGGRRP